MILLSQNVLNVIQVIDLLFLFVYFSRKFNLYFFMDYIFGFFSVLFSFVPLLLVIGLYVFFGYLFISVIVYLYKRFFGDSDDVY